MEQQRQIELLGKKVFTQMCGEKPGMFNKDYWQGRILDWVMQDPSFKIDMFRFVDVLPQLETSEQVSSHVREYLLREGRSLPALIETALKAAAGGIASGLAVKAIRKNVIDMAQRFIVGGDAQSAQEKLRDLHRQGIAFTVDLLGELTLSDQEADVYQKKYLDLIVNLAREAKKWPENKVIDRNHLGPIPRVNVSIKITAMDTQLKSVDPRGAVDRLKKRVMPLFLAAKENNVFINMDLEQWDVHEITYDLFEEIVTDPAIKDWPHVGIVVQAYLKNAHRDVGRLLALAKKRGAPLTIRLVKGAYWDFEVVTAKQRGFECPVFMEKSKTDSNYEMLSGHILDNLEFLNPAFGSHNLRSLVHAMVCAQERGIPKCAYEMQMLYGMAEPERKVLRGIENRIRVYAPIGELLPGMAYLVRRLLENTSNSGFLRMSHHGGVDIQKLLQKPVATLEKNKEMSDEFSNCSFLDFTQTINRHRFQNSISKCRAQFPYQVPVVISGKVEEGREKKQQICPSETKLITGEIVLADRAMCEKAIQKAYAAFPAWRDKPIEARALLLEKLAEILEVDRVHLAALQTLEVGKSWSEADADVAEAIDFCRYYAWRARIELSPRIQGNVWGEHSELSYCGRGPTVVISPWNFPLAILCGMTVAALVSGNTVLMKPSEQSSVTAYFLFERMLKAGFPNDVIHFLPGDGKKIGPYLVEHSLVSQIIFTGSKHVGLQIIERIGKTEIGQPQVKRVVCEMGGKNGIIIDDDADLDEAVVGVMQGAFGFSGQKCSACSRVMVLQAVYDIFVKRLIEACRSLHISPAMDPSCSMGPVIDEEAYRRLKKEIAVGSETAKLLFTKDVPSGGYFIPPTLFEVSRSSDRLMQQEFFGPIVAIMPVANFDQALQIANDTEFALTGAVYSRSPINIEKAKRQFCVGNLYLNRSCTGALVHRQPFGGFKMSGIGTKAGGPNYLLNFVDQRCITENTMRRGFTPDLDS
jgi:RHH-type transcriptional regulator, proline utilization regulon repressor / proline dehydrogenase / delta 1-pyrroline-5-carboxylate dehydrogenase